MNIHATFYLAQITNRYICKYITICLTKFLPMTSSLLILLLLLALVAFLYSSVGHGGASGYLAVMALLSIAPATMKSSALVMNLAVSFFSFVGFYRAGFFRLSLFLPFALASIPMAYIGGTMTLSDSIYKKILAVSILFSIARLFYQIDAPREQQRTAPLWGSLLSGGSIGLISGMIGIGGGIILSPLMLLLKWANLKETAAISALFIFVNSLAGLFGQWQKGAIHLPENMIWAIIVTILGGLAGSYLGSQKFNSPTLKKLLALGLTIACFKLLFT